MRDLWYKDAVIYCLDVETFQDGNGDGVGDFQGLRERLDYIDGLDVTSIWLLPIYPTPNRDNGYDVTDYYDVDPRLGTLGDFVDFMHAARERGLRVLVDLPVNHTSIQHPWFQQGRRDPESPYHDFYVWSDERPEDPGEGVIFPGVQEEVWTYDRSARKYYFHRFYEHQPDLNIANPRVRDEIRKIMAFWLELGVSGFRLDAAPFLIELKGIDAPGDTDPYGYLTEFRDYVSRRRGDAILLAEANVAPEDVSRYFGEGGRMHMLFDFLLNQHLFLALARRDRTPLVKGLHLAPGIPDRAQWASFLRNHDELDLGRLTDVQREEVFDAFAPEPSMRLYERGIRRRLAPMFEGDVARLRMAYSLVLTLPGTPVLRYGEEIGMGEDLSLEERTAVRTPMQWHDGPAAGFSTAPADELVRPVITEGPFGHEAVNVERQSRDPESLLEWMRRAIRARRGAPEFGRGRAVVLETDHPAVFAHACVDGDELRGNRTVLAVHNLDGEARSVRVDVSGLEGSGVTSIFEACEVSEVENGELGLELEGFGYRWFRLVDE